VSPWIVLTIATASTVAACSTQRTGGAGEAGLYGTVLIEPATPVCRPGVPCSRPAKDFTLVFVQDGRAVATVTTDERGRYRIALPAGRYAVRAETARPRRHGLDPGTATVSGDGFTRRDFKYDVGIR
jgi:hypothetical protein